MMHLIAQSLFGPGSTPKDWVQGVISIVLILGLFFFVGWIILQLLRASRSLTGKEVDTILAEAASQSPAAKDDKIVELRFTMYTNFLFWGVRRSITATLPYPQASIVLGKMLRHNLARGWLGPAGVFVPVLTLTEYVQQRKSLRRQLEAKRGA